MTTKAKALDRLIDAIAGENVPMNSQTVAGRLDTLADTLAGDDVTFTARDIAGRISQLAGMIEDGTIVIGGGSKWKPIGDGKTHFWITVVPGAQTVTYNFTKPNGTDGLIDWGDGTEPQAIPAGGRPSHTYESAGDYIVTVDVTSGTLKIGDDTTGGSLIYKDTNLYRQRRINAIEIGNNIQLLKYGLGGNYCLEHLTLPDDSTATPGGMSELWSLREFDVPESVTTISSGFMNSCAACRRVTIPAAVTSIGDAFLANCWSLRELHMKPVMPPTLAAGSGTDAPLYNSYPLIFVPSESVDAYKAASGWSDRASYIFTEPSA